MDKRKLGSQGLEVSAEGLGCMGMTWAYGAAEEADGIATIARALELGVTLFDTAEVYGPYTNEELVGRAVAGHRDEVQIATKFGFDFEGPTPRRRRPPENARRVAEESLRRLGTDHIDLYYQHRVDPDVPIEETVGAMGELVEAGKVRFIGLSEAAPETIRRAHATYPAVGGAERVLAVDARPRGRGAADAARAGDRLRRPTRRSAAASSPARSARSTTSTRTTGAAPTRASRARRSPRTCASPTGWRSSPRASARPRPRSPSPGCSPKATTSSRSPAPKARRVSRRTSAPTDLKLSDAQVAELDAAVSRDAVRGARYDDSGMAMVNN